MDHAAIRRSEGHVPGADDTALFHRSWLPQEPSCAVLLVHGFGEHCGRYEVIGSWLARRGCAVHAYDHRGHGKSDGPRCHVRRFDDYLDDAAAMLARLRDQHPTLPRFLVGHSMGGLVVATLARERAAAARDLAGLVLSAPALIVSVSPWLAGTARALRWVAPRATLESGIDPQGLSTDPEVARAYVADPLVQSRLTLGLAAEMFAAIGRTGPGGADVALPLLVLHGTADPICSPAGSEAFAAAAPNATFRPYPGMRHEIFNEPEQETVFADLFEWISARVATPGRGAAA